MGCHATFESSWESSAASSCQCPSGTRFEEGECIRGNEEGRNVQVVRCPGGYSQTDLLGFDSSARIAEGLMSTPDDAFSIFRCVSVSRCPGDRDPFQTATMCAEGFNSSVPCCAVCKDGFHLTLGGECDECEDERSVLMWVKIAATVVLEFLFVIYMYHRW